LSVNEKIVAIIEHFEKGNRASFAKKIGISTTTLHNYLGPRGSDPTCKILNRIIVAYPSVRLNWLIKDEGEMIDLNNSDNSSNSGTPAVQNSPPCKCCETKDEMIGILKSQISLQSEYIEALKQLSSLKDEQKRKAG
jgi:hypothetical protein